MREVLHVDPRDAVPIWRQIEEGVRRLVASRALVPGVAMPSVRELARELCVNPATVSKAYQRLVDAGVLIVQRGEGTFVADTAPTMRSKERGILLQEGALRFATLALTAGASHHETQQALERAWHTLSAPTEGAGQ